MSPNPSDDSVGEDEVVIRHIPPGTTWISPGPPKRLTSANFRPRVHKNESYVSVSRAGITTEEDFLKLVGGDRANGSHVAYAAVSDIRALGFDVKPEILDDNSGHAGIHATPAASFDDKVMIKRLAVLFRIT
jgi:hypothetical protein